MAQPHWLIGDVHVGLTRSYTRVVTQRDFEIATELSGDHGGYHSDEAFARAAGFPTRIIPGIFQAGLGTRLGGELNLLAREMTFRFNKPVFVGDTLTVTMRITAVDVSRNRIDVAVAVVNERAEEVLSSTGYGYLPKPEWGVPDKPALNVEPSREE